MNDERPALGESAIDIVIDHPAIAALPYWREEAATGIPPHVTLLYPWRTPPVDAASIEALRAAVRGFAPFSLTLDRIATFPQGVVYAAVAPNEPLRALMQAIAARFPDTPPYGGRFSGHAVPHLTLAQCDADALESTRAEAAGALAGVLPLTIGVTAGSVVEQSADAVWAITATLPLEG